MILQIVCHHLPGRSWHEGECRYDDVHVGIQLGNEPHDLVRADTESASWSVPIQVLSRDGSVDFRGPAVQGRRGDRFVYLTWGNAGADGSFAMFRRAKLMLSDVEPLISDREDDARVVARIHLTDDGGGPRCARLCPPALELECHAG
jgi:Family of unknown function (DUF5990)